MTIHFIANGPASVQAEEFSTDTDYFDSTAVTQSARLGYVHTTAVVELPAEVGAASAAGFWVGFDCGFDYGSSRYDKSVDLLSITDGSGDLVGGTTNFTYSNDSEQKAQVYGSSGSSATGSEFTANTGIGVTSLAVHIYTESGNAKADVSFLFQKS